MNEFNNPIRNIYLEAYKTEWKPVYQSANAVIQVRKFFHISRNDCKYHVSILLRNDNCLFCNEPDITFSYYSSSEHTIFRANSNPWTLHLPCWHFMSIVSTNHMTTHTESMITSHWRRINGFHSILELTIKHSYSVSSYLTSNF